MKIILAGTPKLTISTFKEVINNFEVVAIISQPNKKKGRGMVMQETPTAQLARENNIKLFQPNNINEIYDELKEIDFDLFLTFAFGQFIPSKVLNLANKLSINIHGSLLPKYRGAAPIHHAILNNDKEIGITLMQMVKEMDAGDMIFKASQEITSETTTGEAFDIISELAKSNITRWVKDIAEDKFDMIPQPENFSLSPKITKKDVEITKKDKMMDAFRRIKAYNPFPCAFTMIDNKRVKLFNSSLNNVKNAIELHLSDGTIYITEYQFESKKKIKII